MHKIFLIFISCIYMGLAIRLTAGCKMNRHFSDEHAASFDKSWPRRWELQHPSVAEFQEH